MMIYIIARCYGKGSVYAQAKWLKDNRFFYSEWDGEKHWTKLIDESGYAQLRDMIESWRGWRVEKRLQPTEDRRLAMHQDFDVCPAHKQEELAALWRRAIKIGSWCYQCRIRPILEGNICSNCTIVVNART